LSKGFTVNYPAACKVNFGLTCKPTGLGFSDYKSKSVMVNARIQCAGFDLAKEKTPKPKRAAERKSQLQGGLYGAIKKPGDKNRLAPVTPGSLIPRHGGN
jgi:hypothetical protein